MSKRRFCVVFQETLRHQCFESTDDFNASWSVNGTQREELSEPESEVGENIGVWFSPQKEGNFRCQKDLLSVERW